MSQTTIGLNFVPDSCLAYGQPATTPADWFRATYPERIWKYNPWTGKVRSDAEIQLDPQGLQIKVK